MSRPTFSYSAEWDALTGPEVGHSHRSTTSSRHPGTKFEGTVAYRINRLVQCDVCGGRKLDLPGVHGDRWLDGRRVHCVGREVRP